MAQVKNFGVIFHSLIHILYPSPIEFTFRICPHSRRSSQQHHYPQGTAAPLFLKRLTVSLLLHHFYLSSTHSTLCTAAKVIPLKLHIGSYFPLSLKPINDLPFQNKSQSPHNHLRLPHGFLIVYFSSFSNVNSITRSLLTTQLKIVKHLPSPGITNLSLSFIFFPENLPHDYIPCILSVYVFIVCLS